MRKQVGIVHLVYSIIISLIVITFISILAFGASPDAGNQMNVAATAVSIILAVIAIIMTLVDVAGQRQSIIDLKETAENLNESNEMAQKMIQKSIDSVEAFKDSKEALLEAVSQFKDETIQSVKEYGGDTQKLDDRIKELESNFDLNLVNIEKQNSKKLIYKSNFKNNTYSQTIKWLMKNFDADEKMKLSDLYIRLKRQFGTLEATETIEYLLDTKQVIREPGGLVKLSPKLFDK